MSTIAEFTPTGTRLLLIRIVDRRLEGLGWEEIASRLQLDYDEFRLFVEDNLAAIEQKVNSAHQMNMIIAEGKLVKSYEKLMLEGEYKQRVNAANSLNRFLVARIRLHAAQLGLEKDKTRLQALEQRRANAKTKRE